MDFGAEKIDLTTVQFTPELLQCVPTRVARRYRVLPVFLTQRCLSIAVADAGDLDVIDSLAHTLRRDLDIRVAETHQIDEFIKRLYGDGES